ncbi:MAG: type II toxin-antitoxin system RelE/ParE family toxin [Candidatus Competibacteraceae bacterium]
MKPCWFHPEALAEADAAATFYKAQQPELEVRFLEALNDTIVRIRRNPLMYRCVEGSVRKCRILRFPYAVKVVFEKYNHRFESLLLGHKLLLLDGLLRSLRSAGVHPYRRGEWH